MLKEINFAMAVMLAMVISMINISFERRRENKYSSSNKGRDSRGLFLLCIYAVLFIGGYFFFRIPFIYELINENTLIGHNLEKIYTIRWITGTLVLGLYGIRRESIGGVICLIETVYDVFAISDVSWWGGVVLLGASEALFLFGKIQIFRKNILMIVSSTFGVGYIFFYIVGHGIYQEIFEGIIDSPFLEELRTMFFFLGMVALIFEISKVASGKRKLEKEL